ncbi:hypothetical protein Zmor_010458 [Zophobas morio]|uniref:Uncharacterized protein n=1 Tax=Zophobas morio TaxID=2755281 RepID=A0AA38MJV5_9CUCU|nr:hypothetical protein Zmor_010458 [Zophobas morio]
MGITYLEAWASRPRGSRNRSKSTLPLPETRRLGRLNRPPTTDDRRYTATCRNLVPPPTIKKFLSATRSVYDDVNATTCFSESLDV